MDTGSSLTDLVSDEDKVEEIRIRNEIKETKQRILLVERKIEDAEGNVRTALENYKTTSDPNSFKIYENFNSNVLALQGELKQLREQLLLLERKLDKAGKLGLLNFLSSFQLRCSPLSVEAVDLRLPWQSSYDQHITSLMDSFINNTKCFYENISEKMIYQLCMVLGAVGNGKSRLSLESTFRFLQVCSQKWPEKIATFVYIDFFRDAFPSLSGKLIPYVSQLSIRILSSVYDISIPEIISRVNESDLSSLSLRKVCEILSHENGVIVVIIMDEITTIEKIYLQELVSEFSKVVTCGSRFSYGTLLLPLLVGTSNHVIKLILSSFIMNHINLCGLQDDEAKNLFRTCTQDHVKNFLNNNSSTLATMQQSVGNNPRLINVLLWKINESTKSMQDIFELFSKSWNDAAQNLSHFYDPIYWKKFFHASNTEPLAHVCLLALSKQKIRLNDRINGMTIDEARESGLFSLIECSEPGLYILFFPPLFLHAINIWLKLVEPALLDPWKLLNAQDFEGHMEAIRIFRGGLFYYAKRAIVTYAELFPGAIGHPEDLQTQVLNKKLSLVYAHGSYAKHESFHLFPIEGVLTRDGGKHNLLEGNVLIHNVSMAPSFDSGCGHQGSVQPLLPYSFEGHQYKSSLEISNSNRPTTVLKREGSKSIMAEYKKVTNDKHKKFLRDNSGNPIAWMLIIISNKPLQDYELVKKSYEDDRLRTYQLPRNVLVVSHEGFKEYAGVFAQNSLYQDLPKSPERERLTSGIEIKKRSKEPSEREDKSRKKPKFDK